MESARKWERKKGRNKERKKERKKEGRKEQRKERIETYCRVIGKEALKLGNGEENRQIEADS